MRFPIGSRAEIVSVDSRCRPYVKIGDVVTITEGMSPQLMSFVTDSGFHGSMYPDRFKKVDKSPSLLDRAAKLRKTADTLMAECEVLIDEATALEELSKTLDNVVGR